MNNSYLTAYALDFASFLIQKTKNRDKIRNIILFGSVARQDESKESDIDIFVDIIEDNKVIEKEISFILENFIDSVKHKDYWKLFGLYFPYKIIPSAIKLGFNSFQLSTLPIVNFISLSAPNSLQ